MKPHKRKVLSNRRMCAGNDSSSSSGTEEQFTRKPRKRKAPLKLKSQHAQDSVIYDADSELSSTNENHWEGRKKVYYVDEDVSFAFDDSENADPMESDMESSQGHLDEPPVVRQEFAEPTNGAEKPTSSFYSSLKREVKKRTSVVPLHVSFADESLDSIGRPSIKPNKAVQAPFNIKNVMSSTPVPSSLRSPCDKELRVRLPRLSDLASPIAEDHTASVKKQRHVQPKDSLIESLSSGYESMLKSVSSPATESEMKGNFSRKRKASPTPPSYAELMDTEATQSKVDVQSKKPKTARERRKLAIEKLKLKEQRLLEEMAELENYELEIE